MIGLPSSVQYLCGNGHKSLERITFESKPQFLHFVHDSSLSEVQGFFRLEPIGAVDSDIIIDLGLINVESSRDLEVILYYTNFCRIKRPIQVFSVSLSSLLSSFVELIFDIITYIPVSKVPSWFNDENRRLSSWFTLPSLPNNLRIRRLNVCAVHGKYNYCYGFTSFKKIHNKTKNLTWIYHPRCFGTREDEDGEDFVWLSQWKFGNQLEGGDEVIVTVLIGEDFQVEEVGINLVYGDIEDNVPENIDEIENDEVIGGDLTKFQQSTGAYFLAHRTCFGLFCPPDLIRRVFGDNVKIEELNRWTWSGRRILSERKTLDFNEELSSSESDDDES